MLNNDYGMDEEFSMESMPSLRTYNIPKKNKAKEILTKVALDSREAAHLKKEINESMWDASAYSIDLTSMQLVNNSKLEKTYATKRNEMKEQARSDISDSYGYIRLDHMKQKDIQNKILEEGLSTKLQRKYLPAASSSTIGDDQYGIYLSRCVDVLSRYLPLDRLTANKEITLLVCKYMKGKLKAIANQAGKVDATQNKLEPTPDYDGHCSQFFQHGKKLSLDKIYEYSQIYLYEIDLNKMTAENDDVFEEKPRQCIPYALITFRATRKTTVQPQPQMAPAVNGNSTINKAQSNTPTTGLAEAPMIDYGIYMRQRKLVWQGFYHTPKKCLGKFQLVMHTNVTERIPLEGLDIMRVTQSRSWEDLYKTLPSKIFRKPPCQSLKPKEERQGFRFMHSEIQPIHNSPTDFLSRIHSQFIKTKSAGICTLNSGVMVLILPSCELTERLGITPPRYPPILHCIFVGHCLKKPNKLSGPDYEKFVKSNKQSFYGRMSQFEELKRTNKVPESLSKQKFAFSIQQCDLLRDSLIRMYEAVERLKRNARKQKQPTVQQPPNNNNTPDNQPPNETTQETAQPPVNEVNNEPIDKADIKTEASEASDVILLLSSDEDELVIVEENGTNDVANGNTKKTKKKIKYKPSDYCCEDPQCQHASSDNNDSLCLQIAADVSMNDEKDKEEIQTDTSNNKEVLLPDMRSSTNQPNNNNTAATTDLPSQPTGSVNVHPTSTTSEIVEPTNDKNENTSATANSIPTDGVEGSSKIPSENQAQPKQPSKYSNGEMFDFLFDEMKRVRETGSYHLIDETNVALNHDEEKIVSQIESNRRENAKRWRSPPPTSRLHKRSRLERSRSRSPHHSSKSPFRRSSRSPRRRLSRSPRRRSSRSPYRSSRSPHRRLPRSPRRRSSRSPDRRSSRSPRRRLSRSPYRRLSRSPLSQSSRSPHKSSVQSRSRSGSRSRQPSAPQTSDKEEGLKKMQNKADLLVKMARYQSSAIQINEKLQALIKIKEKKATKSNATILTSQSGFTNTGCNELAVSERQRTLKDAEMRCQQSADDNESGPETWLKRAADRISQLDSNSENEKNKNKATDMDISSDEEIVCIPDVRQQNDEQGKSPPKEPTIICDEASVMTEKDEASQKKAESKPESTAQPAVNEQKSEKKENANEALATKKDESENKLLNTSLWENKPPRYRSLQAWADTIDLLECNNFEQNLIAELRSN